MKGKECRITVGGQEILGDGPFKMSTLSDNPVIAAIQRGCDVNISGKLPIAEGAISFDGAYDPLTPEEREWISFADAYKVGDVVDVNIHIENERVAAKAEITEKSDDTISFKIINKEHS